ncbi:MAG: hypothetical protein JST53_10380 [Actinobacteria bacterium]|nr:hypothetical protein [Actinomycetota bacterium]
MRSILKSEPARFPGLVAYEDYARLAEEGRLGQRMDQFVERSAQPAIARLITTRWISWVPS